MVMMPTGGVPSSRANAAVPEMLRCDACKAWQTNLAAISESSRRAGPTEEHVSSTEEEIKGV